MHKKFMGLKDEYISIKQTERWTEDRCQKTEIINHSSVRIILKPILIAAVAFTTSLFNFTYAQSDQWPEYRCDQSLSGFTQKEIPVDLDIKWSFKTGMDIKSSPVVSHNRIVVGSTDTFVYCLDLNGKLLWKFKADNSIEATALIHGKTVYIGDLTGNLYAIDLMTGKQKWMYATEGQINAAPNWFVNNGQLKILVGSYDYFLHCVDAKTGKPTWKYELMNYLHSAVSIHNGVAAFGGCDGYLHQVDIKTGKSKHKYELATYIASSPVMSQNKAFIGDYDGIFYCVNLSTQKIQWQYDNPDFNLPFIASPSASNTSVTATNRDKFVYNFDIETGKLNWKKNTGRKIEASPIVNKKKVLVVNMRGDILVLDIKTGETIWKYQLGIPIFSNPAIVNNNLVVGAQDGNVYYLQ